MPTREEGVKKSKIFADVIDGSALIGLAAAAGLSG